MSPSVKCCFLPSVDLIENIVKCFDNNQLSHIPVTQRYSPTHIRMISLLNSVEMESHPILMLPSVDWCFPSFVDLIENIVKCFNYNQLSNIPAMQHSAPINIRMISVGNTVEMESHPLLMLPWVDWCFPGLRIWLENIEKCLNNNQPSHIPAIQHCFPIHIRMISVGVTLEMEYHPILLLLSVDWCFPRFVLYLIENHENARTTINQAIFLQYNFVPLFIYVWQSFWNSVDMESHALLMLPWLIDVSSRLWILLKIS